MVDLDAPLGQQLLGFTVGEAEPQVPADRQDDDVGWEAAAAKADRALGTGSGRRVLMLAVCRPGRAHRGCNSAPAGPPAGEYGGRVPCGSGLAVPACLASWSEPGNQAKGGDTS
jgi:hypothetical protein